MTIVEMLKAGTGTRVSTGDRWLYWQESQGDLATWVVLERPYGAKKNRIIVETLDEAAAVQALLAD